MAEAPSPPERPPASPWAGAVLLLVVFVSIIGMGIVIPLLPFYGDVFSARPWQVTLLFAGFSAGQFLGELTWGRLSDRIGRRPVMMITILGAAFGYLGLAFAPTIWLAIGARFLGGFFAGNMSTIQSYLVDVTPPERLPGRLGLIGSAFGVGFVVGPSLGGFLAHTDAGAAGFMPPLLLAAGLCVVAGAGVLLFVRESWGGHAKGAPRPGPFDALREALSDAVLRRLMGSTFFSFMGLSAMWSIVGLWGQARFDWGPREIAGAMAISGMASALSQGGVAGHVVMRIGAVSTVMLSLILTSVFFALQTLIAWPVLAVVILTLGVSSHTLSQPATTSLISQAAHPARQGAILGANAAGSSLSRVIGPMLSGFVFTGVGPNAPFLLAACLMFPAAWFAWRGGREMRRRVA